MRAHLANARASNDAGHTAEFVLETNCAVACKRAAQRIRERADAVPPSPWLSAPDGPGLYAIVGVTDDLLEAGLLARIKQAQNGVFVDLPGNAGGQWLDSFLADNPTARWLRIPEPPGE